MGSYPIVLVSLKEEIPENSHSLSLHTHTLKEEHVETEQGDSRLQARTRALTRN